MADVRLADGGFEAQGRYYEPREELRAASVEMGSTRWNKWRLNVERIFFFFLICTIKR